MLNTCGLVCLLHTSEIMQASSDWKHGAMPDPPLPGLEWMSKSLPNPPLPSKIMQANFENATGSSHPPGLRPVPSDIMHSGAGRSILSSLHSSSIMQQSYERATGSYPLPSDATRTSYDRSYLLRPNIVQPSYERASGTYPLSSEENWRCHPSIGSSGHPEMCKRICMFFKRGNCQSGFDCKFCHLPHQQRESHLDKRKRELLSVVAAGTNLRMLMQSMRHRVLSLPYAAAALEFLNTLELLCGSLIDQDDAAILKHRDLRKLAHTLQGRRFSSLISMFLKQLEELLDSSTMNLVNEAVEKLEADILSSERLAADQAALRRQAEWQAQDLLHRVGGNEIIRFSM